MKAIISLFFLSVLCAQNQEINSETIKQLVFTEGDAFHHFIGVDPAQGKIPYFDMNTLNKIDSTDYSYYLEINTKIYYSDLVIKEHSPAKIEANYSTYIEIVDSKGRTVDQQFKEQLITIDKKYLAAAAFKSSRLTFFFALAPDTYLIKVLFEDKNSGKTFSRETEFVLREWKHKDFLISDLEYYDTYTHEPVISLDNNFGNRTDFILIQFQTYQSDLDKNYTFSLDIYKQRKTVEKVGLAFVNFFKSIFSTDTLEEVKEPIYIRTWEEIRAKHFMKHADMIDKALFSDIEFPRNELPPRKLVARVISTLHEQERIAIEEFDDKRVAQLDSINMNTFDFNQNAVVDDGEITIATARNEISSEFSFQWEFIPQTKAEIQDAFEKLTYLNIDSLDYYAGLDLESAQKYFSGIWVNRSTTDEEFMHPLNAMQLYYRKLDFCVANFPDISQDNAGAIDGSRRRFTNRGWISDKAKIYMKYGSPDEIHGDNIFNSKGIMIEHKERPPVQLWVYNQSGRKFYFKENSLITYN